MTAIDPRDISLARIAIENLKERYSLSLQESVLLISKEDTIPINIFTATLSPFQAAVKYLRENQRWTVRDIGQALGKKSSCISAAYRTAQKKNPAPLKAFAGPHNIPVCAFNHGASILESITVYLHEQQLLGFAAIGRLLGRDKRTIWTTYHRALRKRRRS